MLTRRSALAALLVAALQPAPGLARAQGTTTVAGTFHLVWGDPRQPTAPARLRYLLVSDRGEATELMVEERDLRAAGGPLALNGRRIEVVAERLAPSRSEPADTPVLRARSVRAAQPAGLRASLAAPPLQSGTKRYITILCKFSDSPTVETPKATYQAWMGSVYGGLDHFWREVSGSRINLAGTDVVGWYTLPRARADYVTPGPRGGESANLNALFNDCTAQADPVVNFTQYYGINLQFNQDLDGASWGGSRRASLDGAVNQIYGVTWLASWATMFVYAHETGHSLGLPHSSGPYDQVYDSRWDVMSNGSVLDASLQTRVPVHTIAWHKEALLGWVPSNQVFRAGVAAKQTITLERGSTPTTGDYLMAVIPLGNEQFYTVETRRFAGYDGKVPGEAVVLHRVNPLTGDRPARVVDVDDNGDPNDAGAMWLPGETFVDRAAGLSVAVEAATPTGYRVTIHTGAVLGVQVSGMGRVLSDPVGLRCLAERTPGASCSHGFGVGTRVSLTAVPALGWAFSSWGGACSGKGACTTILSDNRDVTASFGRLAFYVESDSVRPVASIAVPYQDTLRVAPATQAGVTWALEGGELPAGLVLEPSGAVRGTPTRLGTSRFTAAATAGALRDVRPFVIRVEPPLVIASDSLRPAAVAGAAYADTLQATGSSGSLLWALRAGAIPPGLALTDATGVLGGVPERAGRYRFTLAATSASGVSVSRTFTLVVKAPALEPARVLDQLLGGSPLRPEEILYLDLLGNRNGRVDVGDVRAWLMENRQIDPAQVPGLSEIVGGLPGPEPKENR